MGSRLEMESHEEPWDLEEYDRASSSLLESLCNLGSLSAQFPKISGDLLGGATLTIGDVDLGIQPLRSPQMWSGPIFQSNHATTGCIPGWCQAFGDGAVDIEPLHCMKKTSRKHMMFLAYRYGVIIAGGGEPIIFQPHRRPSSYCSSLSLPLYVYIYMYIHIYMYI